MKAKKLILETCKGEITLQNVVYQFKNDETIVFEFCYSIFDYDVNKANSIIKTQLLTGRSFFRSETENGYKLLFEYPYYLVRAMYN